MSINLHDRNCPLCHSSASTSMFSFRDYRYHTVTNDFYYHECQSCLHVYLKSYPEKADVVKLYPADLMNYGDIDSSKSFAYKVKNYLDLQSLKKLISKNGIKSIKALDIGCGTGLYLDQLSQLKGTVGIEALEGMEISDHACQVVKSKGYKVYNCLLEDFKENSKYNLIVMQQVVEHLYDLDASFEKLSNLLTDDGIIIIETPNLNCFDRVIFKKYWEGYHVPRHFNLFRKNVFGSWLNKFGLKIHDYQLKIKPVHWIYSIQNILLEKEPRFQGWKKFFTYKNTLLLLIFAPLDIFQLVFFRKSSDIRYILKKDKTLVNLNTQKS